MEKSNRRNKENDRLAEQSPKTHVILSGAAQSAAESKNLRMIVAAVLIGSVIRLRCPAEASPDIASSLPADRGTRLCPASSATGGAGQRGLRLHFVSLRMTAAVVTGKRNDHFAEGTIPSGAQWCNDSLRTVHELSAGTAR